MPYLSRIQLNPLRRHTRYLLDEPRAMKAAVLGGIPSQPVNERVLWRLDGVGGRNATNHPEADGNDQDPQFRQDLLVLTESRPSWEHLVEQAGWPGADTPATPQAEVRDYQPLLDQLQAGQAYAFRLTANPTQSVRQPAPVGGGPGERPRSVRHGHRTVEHQLQWFVERAQRWGFEVPTARSSTDMGDKVHDMRIVARTRRSFRKGNKPDQQHPPAQSKNKGGRSVTLQVVTYEGQLVVTDAERLKEQLLSGCGPGKAYGCGLLTLAPLGADKPSKPSEEGTD